jgi:hypothetical protein
VLAGEPCERVDLLGHAALLVECERDRRDDVPEGGLRSVDARDRRVDVLVEQEADHHQRVVALLERLRVEEGGEARQRLGLVVHGDRDVLLMGRELMADLVVQAFDEGGCGHRGKVSANTVRVP